MFVIGNLNSIRYDTRPAQLSKHLLTSKGHSTHSHLRLRVEYTEGVITRSTSIRVKELADGHLPVLLSFLLSLLGSERVLNTLSGVFEILVHFAAPVLQVLATVILDENLQLLQRMRRLALESGVTLSIHGGWL